MTDVTHFWNQIPGFVSDCVRWCDAHVQHEWNMVSGADPMHVGRDTMCVIFCERSDQVFFEWSYLDGLKHMVD